jgi:hypothetical protein
MSKMQTNLPYLYFAIASSAPARLCEMQIQAGEVNTTIDVTNRTVTDPKQLSCLPPAM